MEQKNQTAKSSGFQTGDAQNSSGGSQSNFTAAGFSFSELPNQSSVYPFNSSYPLTQLPTTLGGPIPPSYPSRFNFNYNPMGPGSNPFSSRVTEPFDNLRELNFSDDEPLPVGTPATTTLPNSRLEKVAIKTFTEFPSIPASDSRSSFAVLMGIQAPPLPVIAVDGENQRVPIDLVAVLDVSGSMDGEKLSLLQSATNFVIDHMLPCDRLSIISFSSQAQRVLPLRRMTDMGRYGAKFAIDHLRAGGSTNIVSGLNMGAKVLEQRRERNPVSSIIFVSDGQDTDHVFSAFPTSKGPPEYLQLLSSSIFRSNSETDGRRKERLIPVHTFGVGMDHDPVALNAIADGSDGTYSFVESAEMIPRSFARCIGGLFSVVAQDVRVVVWSASPGVEIKSIPSGRHRNEIISQQKQGIIHVGDMYAEEKKDFLVYLSIPAHSIYQMVIGDETTGKTPLLDIVCYYRNALTDEIVQIDGTSIEILRPITLSSADRVVNVMVDRQRNRVSVAENIAKAKEMADSGNLNMARDLLSSSRNTLMTSASAQSGDDMVNWLEAELKEISARMENMDLYDRYGRGFVLSGLSAHGAQRGTSRNHTFLEMESLSAAPGSGFSFSAAAGKACAAAYDTPTMFKMQQKVEKRQDAKEQEGWRK